MNKLPSTIKLAKVHTIDVSHKVSQLMIERRSLEMDYFVMVQRITKGADLSSSLYTKIRDKIIAIDKEILDIQESASKEGKPYILTDVSSPSPSPTQPLPKKPKVTKPKRVNLDEQEVEKIMVMNKNVLKRVFKFSNLEECNTSKRSKPYYMSKAEIVKAIDDNPDIKALVPKKYKTMKKEELCQSFFTPEKK